MRILTVGPTGVVAMQRVLQWMAEREEEVWVVDHNDRYRSQLPAGFMFSPLFLPKGGWRAQQALQRAGLGGVVRREVTARLRRVVDEFRPEVYTFITSLPWDRPASKPALGRCWCPRGARSAS